MLKKMLLVVAGMLASMSIAFAAVDVNTADQSALETVKGIGPAKAKAIVEERTKNGPYKDGADLAARVKGFGEKSVAKLQGEGLTIGGKGAAAGAAKADSKAGKKDKAAEAAATPATPAAPAAKADAKAAATAVTADAGKKDKKQ